MELFPSQVYRSIQHYWRRRANKGLKGSSSPSKKVRLVAKLGGESRSTRRSRRVWKLKSANRPILRLQVKVFSPLRLLARMRDAYMDAMLTLASGGGRPSALNKSRRVSDGLIRERRIPKGRQMSERRGDFERRLMIHIYNTLVAEVPGNQCVNQEAAPICVK